MLMLFTANMFYYCRKSQPGLILGILNWGGGIEKG